MGRFWHSFAAMAAVESGGEIVVDRGEDLAELREGIAGALAAVA